ncbi:MAG: glycosyltransferase [Candidatus Sericytochromatia bacterium]
MKKKVRIAIDVLSDVPGQSGQVNIFKNILRLLPEIRPNWDFYIFSTKKLTEYYQEKISKKQENVNWINCWYDNNNGSAKRIITQEIQVPYLLNKYKIDVFLCFPLPFFTPFQKVKTIHRHTCSISIINEVKSKSMRYRLEKLLFSIKKADITIFNSNFERENVRSIGIKEKNSSIIWESYDNNIFSLDKDYNVRKEIEKLFLVDKKVIFIPTGIQPWKNSDLIINFINNNKENLEHKYIFVFTGSSDPEYFNKLKDKYNDVFKTDLIYLAGFCSHEEIAFIGKNSFLVIYPSLVETFGIPPLEMMSLKKPVIISNIPPLLEISGGGSLSFNASSVNDLTEKFFYLINNPDEMNKLANKGFEYVKQFSWKKNAEETALLIDKVLDIN